MAQASKLNSPVPVSEHVVERAVGVQTSEPVVIAPLWTALQNAEHNEQLHVDATYLSRSSRSTRYDGFKVNQLTHKKVSAS